MCGHRLSTDRVDFTYLAECPNDPDHISLSAEATASVHSPEDLFPIEECLTCGADLSVIKQEEQTEVLD